MGLGGVGREGGATAAVYWKHTPPAITGYHRGPGHRAGYKQRAAVARSELNIFFYTYTYIHILYIYIYIYVCLSVFIIHLLLLLLAFFSCCCFLFLSVHLPSSSFFFFFFFFFVSQKEDNKKNAQNIAHSAEPSESRLFQLHRIFCLIEFGPLNRGHLIPQLLKFRHQFFGLEQPPVQRLHETMESCDEGSKSKPTRNA